MMLLRGHVRQAPEGFEDPEGRRGDGTEFADDMSHGKVQFLVVWFIEMTNSVWFTEMRNC